MYVMTSKDKLLLEDYKALGTPEEIRARLSNPYPQADEGYAPMPLSDHDKVRRIMNTFPAKPDSGLLEDDGLGSVPPPPYRIPAPPLKSDSGLLVDDGEDSNYKINDGLEWKR